MVKCRPPSGTTLCQCFAVGMCASAYFESCMTIFGLPLVPLEKYMSMGSAAFVTRRSKSSDAARTPALKSSQPSRSTVAAQTPSGPESSAPTGPPSALTGFPSASNSDRPPPAPLTSIFTCRLGQDASTASVTWAMSPTFVQMMALTSARFRR